MPREIWLIRHGETAWSLSGAHTGRTDIPLTDNGIRGAAAVGAFLAGRKLQLVLTSPLIRARKTCELAGLGEVAQVDDRLAEWDYGAYEGRTRLEIQAERPGWEVFRDGVPGGESITQVAGRARDLIDRALQSEGDVALFAHGHILRILAAVWLGLDPSAGERFALAPTGISILGYEHETRVILHWNVRADAAY